MTVMCKVHVYAQNFRPCPLDVHASDYMGQTYTHMTDRQTDREKPITLPLAPANMQQWVRVATPTDDVIVLVRGIVLSLIHI